MKRAIFTYCRGLYATVAYVTAYVASVLTNYAALNTTSLSYYGTITSNDSRYTNSVSPISSSTWTITNATGITTGVINSVVSYDPSSSTYTFVVNTGSTVFTSTGASVVTLDLTTIFGAAKLTQTPYVMITAGVATLCLVNISPSGSHTICTYYSDLAGNNFVAGTYTLKPQVLTFICK